MILNDKEYLIRLTKEAMEYLNNIEIYLAAGPDNGFADGHNNNAITADLTLIRTSVSEMDRRLACMTDEFHRGYRLDTKKNCPVKTPKQVQAHDDLSLYFNEKDVPLIFRGKPPECGIVTVESRFGWHGVYVVKPDSVKYFAFYDVYAGTRETPRRDHIPDPRIVCRWTKKNGYIICRQSLEMMIGRWECHVKDRYDDISHY